jgi:methyltransferase OMS1
MARATTTFKYAFYTAGFGFYISTAYACWGVTKILQQPTPDPRIRDPEYQSSLLSSSFSYKKIVADYDKELNFHEFMMRITSLRKRVSALAKGRVLEVSAGSGRNLEYLLKNEAIDSLHLADNSKEMLDEARLKGAETEKNVNFYALDCQELTSEFKDDIFDTVIDSFGLCMYFAATNSHQAVLKIQSSYSKR